MLCLSPYLGAAANLDRPTAIGQVRRVGSSVVRAK